MTLKKESGEKSLKLFFSHKDFTLSRVVLGSWQN